MLLVKLLHTKKRIVKPFMDYHKTLFLILFVFCFGLITHAQEETGVSTIKGTVLNAANDDPLNNVNIINLTRVNGSVSHKDGSFTIQAAVNDTLYFTFLGFQSMQVRVTKDWIKYGHVKVKMTESAIALEPVQVNALKLTGYLEIDAKNIPIYNNLQYRIAGLGLGYEGGAEQPTGFSKTLSSIFSPIDFLHNLFGNKPRQMRKLQEMKDDDEIQHLLEQKFDRETIAVLLQVSKSEINNILRHCNYSKTFIKTANDLQILEAINDCYEKYRILKDK